MRHNKGYKVLVNILNTEGVPSPGGKKWGYSTVCSILHNDAYIGHKTWNRYDYVNFGKKKKPREEWIVVKDAHPPITDLDTYNAVRAKSLERIVVSSKKFTTVTAKKLTTPRRLILS